MTKLEALLQQAHALSPAELDQLVRLLSARAFGDSSDGEAAVGERGLASWTESVGHEDWSAYYPDSLRNGGPPRS